MAVIVATQITNQAPPVIITETAMTTSDTLSYTAGSGQILKIRNPSAGVLTITIVGTSPISPSVPNTGTVFSTATGKVITVGIGAHVAVQLDKISAYLGGNAAAVIVTGGVGGFASIIS